MMSESRVANVVDARPTQRRNWYSLPKPLQAACAGVVAVLLLALALISAPPKSVRADDGPRSGPKVQVPDPANRSAFVAEIQRTLKNQYDRMINLANQLIDDPGRPENLEDQLAIQKTKIETAKANLLSAQLAREIAEIAVTEYEQGILVPEKAAVDEEIKIARGELEKARQRVPEVKDRLVRIRLASKGSTSDLNNEFAFIGQEEVAQLEAQAARFVLEQAESKLKVLLEYTKPKRLKELRSNVEKARSDELAKRATRDLEMSKLKWLESAIKARDLPSPKHDTRKLHDRQALALLARAIPIEERLRTKLEQLAKDETPDQPVRKEIQDLSDQLQALIDQAEIERSAAQFDMLKSRFH